MINELGDRNFTTGCPAELAIEAAEEGVREALHRLFPNATLPPIPPPHNFTCNGTSYLARLDLWPVPYGGGLERYFGILAGYLVAVFTGTYAVLHCTMRRLE